MIALEVPSSLDASRIRLTIHAENEGPMAALMQAPVLSVNDFSVGIDERQDGGWEISAKAPVAGLRVIWPDVAEKDKANIERLVRETLLQGVTHPIASFEGDLRAPENGSSLLRVTGTLRLRGQARPVEVVFREESAEWVGRLTIRQTDFGIAPVSAFLGALRSRDEVTLEFRVRLKA